MFEFFKRLFSPAIFIIDYADGKCVISRGKVLRAFLRDCEDIFKENSVKKASIYDIVSGRDIRLDFSNNLSEAVKQRLRNIWSCCK